MKGLLKFITCGSVDDGKSTLIGHILYDAKLLYADQEQALQLDSKVGSRGGAIDYSLLLDGLMAEREQGITIDVAYRYFSTQKRSFIVADTPGHEEYTRNMAVGASFADLAIILVDAVHGVLVQTRRHARICSLMGIRHFVFAVNKMDLVGYGKERFDEVSAQISQVVAELGLEDVAIIPVSATEGDNVTRKSQAMPWYGGKTILQHLEDVDIGSSESSFAECTFLMPVQRVCRPNHEFRGFMGQVEEGQVRVGDEVTLLPSHEHARIKKILCGFAESQEASCGQAVNVVLDREVDVSRGCVLCAGKAPPVSDSVRATVLWMDDTPLEVGKNFFAKLGTKQIPALVTAIHFLVDVNSGEHKATGSLRKNEIASVDISFTEPVVVDTFARHKVLGSLILIDRITNMTSACGVVEQTGGTSQKTRGGADVHARAALNGQTPLVVECILGQNGVSEGFVAQVEQKLLDERRHTYRYVPTAAEDYRAVCAHLYDAGLVVLLALDGRIAAASAPEQEKTPGYYRGWQQNLVKASADDVAADIKRRTAYGASSGEYVI